MVSRLPDRTLTAGVGWQHRRHDCVPDYFMYGIRIVQERLLARSRHLPPGHIPASATQNVGVVRHPVCAPIGAI